MKLTGLGGKGGLLSLAAGCGRGQLRQGDDNRPGETPRTCRPVQPCSPIIHRATRAASFIPSGWLGNENSYFEHREAVATRSDCTSDI